MKKTKTSTTSEIENALAMYRETVSPTFPMLESILNQIPEKPIKKKEVQAIRSPYIWLAITQAVTVCTILFVLAPTLSESYLSRNDPFYSIDKDVERFEQRINDEDAGQLMLDYSNNNL